MASGFLLNPSATDLWRTNAVLNGVAKSHDVGAVSGTLSIKTLLRGKAVWETPHGRYDLDPETFLILNEGQSYRLTIESSEPVETFCIFLRPGIFPDSPNNPGFYERKRLKTPAMLAALNSLISLVREGAHAGLEADDTLSNLLTVLSSEEEVGRTEVAKLNYTSLAARVEVFRLLNLTRDFMLSNLHRPLQLEEIASVAFLSPFHFHRLHRQAFGETPHEFVTRARLQRAQRMLQGGESVSEVSLQLGFESLPTFTRLFKSRLGVTPGAFRKIG